MGLVGGMIIPERTQGSIKWGSSVSSGSYISISDSKPAALQLLDGAVVKSLHYQPQGLSHLISATSAEGWKPISRPGGGSRATWTFDRGTIRATGGPGCLEYQGEQFANFVLQLEVRTKLRHANGGVFFRSMPGSFMNGYEAQIYNRCHDGDVSKPWTWATGAIDDRQNTRRLVSRDGEWFHYTIIAQGDRIATWVNGYQTVDFKDERKEHENPRLGKRTKAGTLQLQAHDVGTEIEFRNIRIAEWK